MGCLLGKETAEKLFGSRDVDGLSLRYGERELTVRGVFDAPGEMVVVAADSDSECFGRIAMRSAQQLPEGLAAGRFIAEYGLDARQVRYDIFGADYLQGMIPGKWSDFDGRKVLAGCVRILDFCCGWKRAAWNSGIWNAGEGLPPARWPPCYCC